jgi:hypothetical protein
MLAKEGSFHWMITAILLNQEILRNCYSRFYFSFTGLGKTINTQNDYMLYLKRTAMI